MRTGVPQDLACTIALLAALGWPAASGAEPPATGTPPVEAALQNVISLERPSEDGLATVWDGDKYVQCRRLPNRDLHCEAAGVRLQSSMRYVLTPARAERLAALGWKVDPAFGNYAQTFPSGMPLGEVAKRIVTTLAEGYDADVAHLEVQSDWIVSEPCPPRNGPNQNLAGMINDSPSMAATAIHACAYASGANPAPQAAPLSASDLFDVYGGRVTGEVQRLRINLNRPIWLILDTDVGYVQCQPQTATAAIYCEAESADSWPGLASILTPERLARLHAAGFADPGRAPNYSKAYPLDKADDATIARELLTILHEVYGYGGAPKLSVKTEKDGD